ncbi:MAG: SLC13 family permease [Halobacteria archaeon]|nr:SLC13 family permease [Halobacteria archaeon]
MTTDQAVLFTLLFFVFAFLIWGRLRYDLVAFIALTAALLLGVVPKEQAFSGFGHPATIIIALVLIVSKGLSNSGVVELVARQVSRFSQSVQTHITAMSGIAAGLSAVMNNVAALALLMPVDIQAANKAKRCLSLTLMPLSFATILGGLITMIGTPPNIIIAEFRQQALGESFAMFDFAPVGLACAVAGVVFVALIGWRLLPAGCREADPARQLLDVAGYVAELHVPENSPAIGQRVRDLDAVAEDNDVAIVGLIRRAKRLPGHARLAVVDAGDILVVEALPEAIDKIAGALKLDYQAKGRDSGSLSSDDMSLLEVVVPGGARIEGRTAFALRLQNRFDVTLLGVLRQGKQFRQRVRHVDIRAGDVLLLFGPVETLTAISSWLGTLPLASSRDLALIKRHKAWLAAGLFALAILLASTGVVYLPVALGIVVAAYVLLNILHARQVYDSVEWPVIVLLGSMIPFGTALETSGGTALIADAITGLAAGYSPVVVLTLLMVVTMTLSDVMNNTATAVIAAPIALDIANRLQVNPDPFLMAVAVAASCAFLTPIGHKNNTLVMGPGGYRFGDYWRMGLPLEILIVLVSVPMILWVWPF